jgi:membrane protease YdiL (CAAX protease family)
MESFVTVATFDFRADAEVAKLLLEQDGIKTFLADENLVGVNWFLSNAVGGVKLQVAAADVDRAGEILQRAQPVKAETEGDLPDEDITFACQECGKKITFPGERRGHVETCPECGSYIDVPHRTEPAFVAGPGETDQSKVPDAAARTTGQLWIEVSAILCLAYLPWLYSALAVIAEPTRCSFINEMLSRIIDSLQISLPTLVIIALSKDRWSKFGIVRPRWGLDVSVGCVIWFSCVLFHRVVVCLLPLSMLERSASLHIVDHAYPEGLPAHLLLLTTFVTGAFAEELIFRAYLIARFERLLHSTWAAVLVTTAMFASYHVYYQDAASVIGVAAIGLVCAISFCLLRRLWPVCLAHALYNAMLPF